MAGGAARLGLGVAVLAGQDTWLDPPVRAVLLGAGLTVAGLVLPLAVSLLGYAAAAAAGRIRRAPVWLQLAGARVRHSPGGAPRLVAALAVAIYVAGFGVLGTVVAANIHAVPVPAGWHNELSYQLRGPDRELVTRLRATPGIRVMDVAGIDATIGGRRAHILVADCADFTEMYRLSRGQSCVDGETYRLDFRRSGEPDLSSPGVAAVTGDGLRIPAPDNTLHPVALRHSGGSVGALLVTRRAPVLAGRPAPDPAPEVIAVDREAADRANRLVAARMPATSLRGDLGFRAGFDEDLVATLLTAGMIVSFVLGVGSFVVAIADRAMERRRDNAALAVLGTRPALLALAEAGYAAIPLIVGFLLAGLSTVVMAVSLAGLLGMGTRVVLAGIAPVGWLGAGAVSVALVIIGVLARLTHRVGPEQLRRP